MSDEPYWGASAPWAMAGQYDVMRYSGGPPGQSWFTLPADHPNNYDTIWDVWDRIMSQHPEKISVLADQWVNLANLLQEVRDQLSHWGNTLAAEAWRSSDARREFLRLGPGAALAHLDQWIDAAWRNIGVLRAAVGVARRARTDMENLVRAYNAALERARNLNPGVISQFGALDWSGSWKWLAGWGGHSNVDQVRDDWNEARDELRARAVEDAQTQYNRVARNLAWRVANEYLDTVSSGQRGFGPYFVPMDTVLNKGAIGWMAPPPPLMPKVNPPGVVPDMPPGPGDALAFPEGSMPGGPSGPVAPEPAGVPGLYPGVYPGLYPGAVPPLPRSLGGPSPYAPGAPRAAMPGLPGQGAIPPRLPPGMPRGGVLRRAGNRPGDPQLHGPAPTEETFTVPPRNAAPPVLRNPRKATPGRSVPTAPGIGQEEFPTAPVGASPPVLGAPARALPPVPPVRQRDRDTTVSTPAEGDFDHLGLDGLRAQAGEPVLDAPASVTGASIDARADIRAARRGPAEAGELPTRRAAQRSEAAAPEEAAFTVDTPGGAVVAKGREETDVRPEPPATLSGPGVAGAGG